MMALLTGEKKSKLTVESGETASGITPKTKSNHYIFGKIFSFFHAVSVPIETGAR